MTFSFHPYSIIFFAGGLICLCLAVAAWSRRPSPGTVPLAALLLAAAVWTIPCAFESGAAELSVRIICSKIAYLGIVSSGVLWFAFTLDYTGITWWKHPRNIILLSVIPLITLILVWTNEYHGWIWSKVYMIDGPLGPTSVWQHGHWFLVNPLYQYGLHIFGMVVLLRFGLKKPRIHLKPIIICLVGTAIPLAGSILYVFGINPAKGFDFTPFYISTGAIFYYIAIIAFPLIDIIPQAHRLIVKNNPFGVLVLNSEGYIIETNQAAVKILGKEEASIRGALLTKLCPEIGYVISNSSEFHRIELKFDNSQLASYLDVTLRTLRDTNNRIIGKLVILGDISERKKTEEALYASEQKYRSLVNNVKLGIFRTTLDAKGKFLEVNQAFETIFGYTRSELMAMNVSDLYSVPEQRKHLVERIMSLSGGTTYEQCFKRKDKTEITVSITISAVRDEQGKAVYLDGILEDVTDRKHMEKVLLKLYEKEKSQCEELLEEARARGMFIDILAHELRTPLTPIILSSMTLEELIENNSDLTHKRLIVNIRKGAEALKCRLDQLLDLARFSRGAFKLDLEPVDVKTYLTDVISLFKPATDQRKQCLKVEIAEDVSLVDLDSSRLEQVLINLLSNASKFTREEGSIRLKACQNNGCLEIQIIDNGIGISNEEQKKLFQPYHRVQQDRFNYQGMGLGLAISRQIIEAHGGKIWVTSEPRQGSTFGFQIPVRQLINLRENNSGKTAVY